MPPDLDPESQRVLAMFLRLPMGAFEYAQTGLRLGIKRDALQIEAALRGWDLSEYDLDKLAACEDVIRDFDAERLKQPDTNDGRQRTQSPNHRNFR